MNLWVAIIVAYKRRNKMPFQMHGHSMQAALYVSLERNRIDLLDLLE
jgi:hypothetical protein